MLAALFIAMYVYSFAVGVGATGAAGFDASVGQVFFAIGTVVGIGMAALRTYIWVWGSKHTAEKKPPPLAFNFEATAAALCVTGALGACAILVMETAGFVPTTFLVYAKGTGVAALVFGILALGFDWGGALSAKTWFR